MKKQEKLWAIIMGVLAGFSAGYWTSSVFNGLLFAISVFNMFVLMGITAENTD